MRAAKIFLTDLHEHGIVDKVRQCHRLCAYRQLIRCLNVGGHDQSDFVSELLRSSAESQSPLAQIWLAGFNGYDPLIYPVASILTVLV